MYFYVANVSGENIVRTIDCRSALFCLLLLLKHHVARLTGTLKNNFSCVLREHFILAEIELSLSINQLPSKKKSFDPGASFTRCGPSCF